VVTSSGFFIEGLNGRHRREVCRGIVTVEEDYLIEVPRHVEEWFVCVSSIEAKIAGSSK
jgi:hypothetical protein